MRAVSSLVSLSALASSSAFVAPGESLALKPNKPTQMHVCGDKAFTARYLPGTRVVPDELQTASQPARHEDSLLVLAFSRPLKVLLCGHVVYYRRVMLSLDRQLRFLPGTLVHTAVSYQVGTEYQASSRRAPDRHEGFLTSELSRAVP